MGRRGPFSIDIEDPDSLRKLSKALPETRELSFDQIESNNTSYKIKNKSHVVVQKMIFRTWFCTNRFAQGFWPMAEGRSPWFQGLQGDLLRISGTQDSPCGGHVK